MEKQKFCVKFGKTKMLCKKAKNLVEKIKNFGVNKYPRQIDPDGKSFQGPVKYFLDKTIFSDKKNFFLRQKIFRIIIRIYCR